jgi:hypothetical protein
MCERGGGVERGKAWASLEIEREEQNNPSMKTHNIGWATLSPTAFKPAK